MVLFKVLQQQLPARTEENEECFEQDSHCPSWESYPSRPESK